MTVGLTQELAAALQASGAKGLELNFPHLGKWMHLASPGVTAANE